MKTILETVRVTHEVLVSYEIPDAFTLVEQHGSNWIEVTSGGIKHLVSLEVAARRGMIKATPFKENGEK